MEEIKHYYIYMHQNNINNKVYVGVTSETDIQNRWKNGRNYRSCTCFNEAVNEYGWENFSHIIIEEGEFTIKDAWDREAFWIEQYDATNPVFGYNVIKNMSQGLPNYAKERAYKWKQEHPEVGLMKAQLMLQWQKENKEEMLKMRHINIQKATVSRERQVMCIETEVVYNSAAEAARCVSNTTQSKICMCCRGQRKTCGDFHWRYVNEK